MADEFKVDTDALQGMAEKLRTQSETAAKLGQDAHAANVAPKSWGALGLTVGLFSQYTVLRDQAYTSLAKSQSYLSWMSETVRDVAVAYEAVDTGAAQSFSEIEGTLQ